VDVGELAAYLASLHPEVEVIVVDGSPPDVFAHHAAGLPDRVGHVAPDDDLHTLNGKVGGVLTGLRRASHERVVIADDDVRYSETSLARTVGGLDRFDVVRPQNHFVPARGHAAWDTSRILLNRVTGGDWPGTLAVRRDRLLSAGGYRGDVLFENLELIRTIRAAGGELWTPLDLYVRRLPPTASGFLDQRVRQAYDELARPLRLACWLSVLPLVGLAAARHAWRPLLAGTLGVVAAAEIGRRRAGGRRVFPARASLMAPGWVLERGACAWLAVGSRFLLGGVRYRGRVIREAASSEAALRRRLGQRSRVAS
jgi:Glycosyl transferase family 2